MARWRPGELDQIITINREVETGDGFGGQELSLTPVLTDIAAKVVPRSGNERELAERIEAPAQYTFIIRNRQNVTIQDDDRIVWDGEEYNISFVRRAGGRAMYLEIEASRGVAQ